MLPEAKNCNFSYLNQKLDIFWLSWGNTQLGLTVLALILT